MSHEHDPNRLAGLTVDEIVELLHDADELEHLGIGPSDWESLPENTQMAIRDVMAEEEHEEEKEK